MLQILHDTNVPFMKWRRFAYMFSGACVLATALWLVMHHGPRLSVDFTGGTLIDVGTSQPMQVDEIRSAADKAGFHGAEIQSAGEQNKEFYVRLGHQQGAETFPPLKQAIETAHPGTVAELRGQTAVGPKVGSELASRALWAIVLSIFGILVYVGIRYEFKFAIGAIIALFHDVFIVFGILCIAGREINLTSVAALLTLAGYSMNDTIVVFDRIRERMKTLSKETHERAFDIALNETLSRTIITSFTVFLTSLSLYMFGGEVINDFALAMVAGVLFGTYSSIYVASALALEMWNWTDRRKRAVRRAA
jgi:preprotein translocase SecF subunit